MWRTCSPELNTPSKCMISRQRQMRALRRLLRSKRKSVFSHIYASQMWWSWKGNLRRRITFASWWNCATTVTLNRLSRQGRHSQNSKFSSICGRSFSGCTTYRRTVYCIGTLTCRIYSWATVWKSRSGTSAALRSSITTSPTALTPWATILSTCRQRCSLRRDTTSIRLTIGK